MNYDYLIVGQGLAGTCLAHHLLDAGKKVCVMDEDRENTSSKVAAGLFNPVTGRRMVLTWKADKLFPYLHEFYRKKEKLLKTNFFHQNTIYRPFISTEEQNEWMGKSSLDSFKPYVDKVHSTSKYGHHLKDEYGGLELTNSGYLDIALFLEASKHYFEELRMLVTEVFDYSALKVDSGIGYKDLTAEKIIFCTGVSNTPLFSWLPFSPVKGEVLEIRPEEAIEKIYNRGVFVLPRSREVCRVGSTYDNKDLSIEITEGARNTLVKKLETILTLNYVITGQKAGIRPATKDRRPFIGFHPEREDVVIFNGLGAKGVSLAPYYSQQLTRRLVAGADIDFEVNINRYYSLYYELE